MEAAQVQDSLPANSAFRSQPRATSWTETEYIFIWSTEKGSIGYHINIG
jgi:hypothetical protein